MSYYISKTLQIPFTDAITRVTDALREEGFGVLTDIDVEATLRSKLNVDFRPYRILGACNPALAHQALQAEPRVGIMLPCNVIVQDDGKGGVEVAAVDPVASMMAIDNPHLGELAQQVQAKLRSVIESL
jgi:uncharacterized protein (DUF302 family)